MGMLLSAIQADAAQLSYNRGGGHGDVVATEEDMGHVMDMEMQLSHNRGDGEQPYSLGSTDGDVVATPVAAGGGNGIATSGAGPLDLNDAMQTLADAKADASEMRQRKIEDHLHEVEQKRYVVAAKLRGIDLIVKSDEDRHRMLKEKGLLTDDRNAKNYLHDAETVVTGKIELKIEKRARFAAEVTQQQHNIARNEALVVKKQEQVTVVEAKIEEQKNESYTLGNLTLKEAELARGVALSQQSRLSDINVKLGLDKSAIEALTGTLQTERAQETALTSQLAKIVHNGDEVTKIQAQLTSKTEQLVLKNQELEIATATAAQEKADCGQNTVLLAEQKAMPRAGGFLEKAGRQ